MFASHPFTLHPYEIAGQIAMLDTVSRGRAYLGLAKGAWLDRLGIDEPRPLDALREAVKSPSPEVKNRMVSQGADPAFLGSEDFAKFLASEMPRWADAVKKSGAKLD